MCIKGIHLHRSDGTVEKYKTFEKWEGLSGALTTDFTLAVQDHTYYRLDATNAGEGTMLTLNWTDMRNAVPGHFRVSVKTGANTLKVKFLTDYGDWFAIKKDVEFYYDPETFEIDDTIIVLEEYGRYLIEFFEDHITVEKYYDPTILIDLGGDTGEEDTGTDTGGDSGTETENPDILYIYKSGDTDFSNCSYTVDNWTEVYPPGTNYSDRGALTQGDDKSPEDAITVKYTHDDNTHPGSFNYFTLGVTATFAEYSKLYIEVGRDSALGAQSQVGFYNADESADDGDIFYDTGYVFQTASTTRTVYEFDISGCTLSKTVAFLIVSGRLQYIYNIWLEK